MYEIGEYDARKCNSMLKAVIMMILIATAFIEFSFTTQLNCIPIEFH